MRRCKKVLVRCFLVATVLAGCICLLACQRTPTELTELEEDESITVRQSKTQNLSGLPAGYAVLSGTIANDKMRIMADSDDTSKEVLTYIVDLNDWTARKVNYEGKVDSSLGKEFQEDGSFIALGYEMQPLRLCVKKYDQDGKLTLNQDVTDLITQVRTEGGSPADGCFVELHTSKDKVIVVMAHQLIVLSDDCTKAEYVPLEDGQIVSSAKMKDGQIICAVETNDRNRYLQAWNPNTGKWTDSVEVINYWSFQHNLDFQNKEKGMLLDGSEYDFYYKNYYYIYGFNWKDKTCVKLIDNEKSKINNEHGEAYDMLPLWNGNMISMKIDATYYGENGFQIYIPSGATEK